MADDPQSKPREPAKDTPAEEERIPTPDLITGARRLLGCSPIAATGALADSDRKTHTLKQAQELLKDFQQRPVT